MGVSNTKQPAVSELAIEKLPDEQKQIIRELVQNIGRTVVMQTHDGGQAPVRVNKANGYALEVWDGKNWQSIGTNGVTAGQTASQKGLSGQLITVPVVFTGSVKLSGNVGFFGATPVEKTVVADPIASIGAALASITTADNEIGALTFSNPPTQAECEALRDKCEKLRDDVDAVRAAAAKLSDVGSLLTTVADAINALQALGLL